MSSECADEKFELLDSIDHPLKSYPVIISYMKLFVEPDFNSRAIYCLQDIKLLCLEDLDDYAVELDSVDLNIKKILYRDSESVEPVDELPFVCSDEKLIIRLPRLLKKDAYFLLQISYWAHPQKGFHFITPDNYHPDKEVQAWTQGQMIESRFWFPCIDDPQIKYTREVSVSVSHEFVVISNGRLEEVSYTKEHKKIYRWKLDSPDSAYLTSIVVGKFVENMETYERGIELLYYVPKDKQDRTKRSFKGTAGVLNFFESYFDTPYSYSKYAQTTVQDFEYGGMENTSCTTLKEEILLDEKASFDDFPSTHIESTRSVVTHELAHQWFGDLVTCKDWSHIWLNEGFATYCEALYIEHVDGKDEFQRYMDILAVYYFSESCSDYRRPIVNCKYKYPDELFDYHSYKKGAWILHMLRNIVGDDKFRTGLKRYLEIFRNGIVETGDLRDVMEEVSGKNLNNFFGQWVYSKGHPEMTIEYNEEKNLIKIAQQMKPFFEFKLEIKIALSNKNPPKTFEFPIKAQENNVIEIPISRENGKSNKVEWFSIDPELKVLKEIKSSNVPQLMILNQIRNGNTIIERRQALDAIDYKKISKDNLEEKLIQILTDRVIHDDYFGVSTRAAGKLGQMKSEKALDALLECLGSNVLKNKPNGEAIRRWIVSAIGGYISDLDTEKRDRIINKLEEIACHGAKSYYVESEALMALGEYIHERSYQILSEAIEKPNTFNDIIPTAAIRGLAKYSKALEKIKSNEVKENEKLKLEILLKKAVDILIKKTQNWNSNNVRTAAVDSLKMFLLENDGDVNKIIFEVMIHSLDDKWSEVRKTALAILETTFSPDDKVFEELVIEQLVIKIQKMTETDLNYGVRRNAELCLLAIRGRHLRKLRTIMKTKEDMSRYVSEKVGIRTKLASGSSLRLKQRLE